MRMRYQFCSSVDVERCSDQSLLDRLWRLAWLGVRHFLNKTVQILQMFRKYIVAGLYN